MQPLDDPVAVQIAQSDDRVGRSDEWLSLSGDRQSRARLLGDGIGEPSAQSRVCVAFRHEDGRRRLALNGDRCGKVEVTDFVDAVAAQRQQWETCPHFCLIDLL